jgi:plastocyanin
VGPRRRLLFVMAAVLGAAIVVMPAVAGSETVPTIEAVNTSGIYKEQRHYWSPPQVTVVPGGTVTLSDPTAVAHGVHWVGGPAIPACSPSVPVGTEATASASQWSGTCTFATAGVYTFYCTVHGPEMTGQVTVSAAGTTTGTATTGTGQAPMPPPGGASPAEAGPPAPSPTGASPLASNAVRLAGGPHARFVRGSLVVSTAAAGGRLEVDLLARRAALALAGGRSLARVGRLVRTALPAGALGFRVGLDRAALAALHAHRRLALTVRIVLTPPRGASVAVSRSLLLRA